MSVAQKLAILEQCKSDIKSAIVGKGGTVTATSGFSTFADEIAGIPIGELIDRSIRELTVPSGVQTIGAYSLYACRYLRTLNMPDSVTTIGSNAFASCDRLQSIRLSKQLTSIASYVFRYCYKLQPITLPNTIETVSSFAFQGCNEGLIRIVIPPGVGLISTSLFDSCTNLATIVLMKNDGIVTLQYVNAFNDTPFASGGAGGTAYVPSSLISAYQSDTKWSSLNCTFKSFREEAFTGDGATKTFTLSGTHDSLFYVIVSGVTMYPAEDYTYSAANTTITFTTAPANTATIKIYHDDSQSA